MKKYLRKLLTFLALNIVIWSGTVTPVKNAKAASMLEYTLLAALINVEILKSVKVITCSIKVRFDQISGQISGTPTGDVTCSQITPNATSSLQSSTTATSTAVTDPYMLSFQSTAQLALNSCSSASAMCNTLRTNLTAAYTNYYKSYSEKDKACSASASSSDCQIASLKLTNVLASAVEYYRFTNQFCAASSQICANSAQ